MLSGRRKKDYDAETAADALAAQAAHLGETPAGDSIPASEPIADDDLDDETGESADEEAVNAA